MVISPALEASPIGRLSTELRLMIWEFALQKDYDIQLNHVAAKDTGNAAATKPNEVAANATADAVVADGGELNVFAPDDDLVTEVEPPMLSLAQTCRQIRDETMPIFLESNSFHTSCPIFDDSKGHGEISSDATQYHQQGLLRRLQNLEHEDGTWPSRIKNLTLDIGIWRICGCKSSSQSFVDALSTFSTIFPPQKGRTLKVLFQVQWRAICLGCESDTDDESVWPLKFELERRNNDKFFERILEVCEGRAKWILEKQRLCERTRMAWLVQLKRASGRLVEVFGCLGRRGRQWENVDEGDGMNEGEARGEVDEMDEVDGVNEVEETSS